MRVIDDSKATTIVATVAARWMAWQRPPGCSQAATAKGRTLENWPGCRGIAAAVHLIGKGCRRDCRCACRPAACRGGNLHRSKMRSLLRSMARRPATSPVVTGLCQPGTCSATLVIAPKCSCARSEIKASRGRALVSRGVAERGISA